MKLIIKIASYCLHVPVRIYDLLAIVLISTGINVATGSGGTAHEKLAFASGILFCCAGVLASLLKGRGDDILRAVESNIENRAREAENRLTAIDPKNSTAAPAASQPSRGDEKEMSSPLDEVINERLKNEPGLAWSVTKQFVFLLFLFALGTISTYKANYADENTGFSEKLESVVTSVHKKVQSECERIESELTSISCSNSDNHSQLVDYTVARFQEVTSQLESLKDDVALLSDLLSNDANISGADPEPREDAVDE